MEFLLTDQVGTLMAVADSTGAIVKRIDYDSFGNIIADSNPSFSVPFGFAGGLHDRDTGLVRFGYRDYSPELGRFVAKDPLDFGGGDTNLYAYVENDPVNWVDPEGLVRKSSGNLKPGSTPPGKWPTPPEYLKPKWDKEGFYSCSGKRRLTWDDRSHGSGIDRGSGPQGGHWDDETSKNKWNEKGELLPGSPDLKMEEISGNPLFPVIPLLVNPAVPGVPAFPVRVPIPQPLFGL